MKRYIAKSQIAISVNYPDGSHKHVVFSARTSGGSYYYTSDTNEQNALESHSKFGRLFKIDPLFIDETPVAKEQVAEAASEPVADAQTPKIQTVSVSDLAAAKDYLCDRFGFSRTKLRTKAAIIEAAKSKNIVFEGIN